MSGALTSLAYNFAETAGHLYVFTDKPQVLLELFQITDLSDVVTVKRAL